jgi:hypothetical protein
VTYKNLLQLEDCPLSSVQYIRSYLPHLEAVSSVRNQRTPLVTRDPRNMARRQLGYYYYYYYYYYYVTIF